MKIVDLCCGAGGMSMGLHIQFPEAQIIGVDIALQPHYPFKFYQHDALDVDLTGFDLAVASPPCQGYSVTRILWDREYPMLIDPMRKMLKGSHVAYCIENVEGARKHMVNPVRLCGRQFGLGVIRHRLFETNFHVRELHHFKHGSEKYVPVGRVVTDLDRYMTVTGHFTSVEPGERERMGIWWMNRDELAQAIPPVYSWYIGEQWRLHH